MLTGAEVSLIVKAKDEASATLNRIHGTARGVGKGIGTALKVGALAAAAGVAVLAVGLSGALKAANEQIRVETQLDAVIKSTGGSAGLTAKEIKTMAAELQKQTTYGDEAIIAGQNLLLTFTKIGKDVFPDATKAMLNMSTAMGQDLSQTAIQVGKALNDPVQGVSALRRVGVQLTDAQEKLIKSMVEVGDIAGAQKVILGELETQFGGSAEAAAGTFAGRMKQLSNQIGDVKERIGFALMPVLFLLAGVMINHVVPAIEKIVDAGFAFGSMIKAALTGDVATAAEMFNRLPGPLQTVAKWLAENRDRIEGLIFKARAIAVVIGGILLAALRGWVTIFQALAPHLQRFGEFLIEHKPLLIALGIALLAAAAILIGIPALILAIIIVGGLLVEHWEEIKAKTIEVWNSIPGPIQDALKLIWMTVQFVFAIIRNYVETTVKVIVGIVQVAMALLRGDWSAAWEGIKQIAADIWEGIKTDIVLRVGFIRDVLLFAWAYIRSALEGIWNALKSAATAAWNGIRDAIVGPIETVIGWIDSLIDKIKSIPPMPDLTPGFDVPGVPGFAAGVRNFRGGLALVGEQGSELVVLPPGTDIHSNSDTRRMVGAQAGGMTVGTMNVILPNVREPQDFARELDRYFRGAA